VTCHYTNRIHEYLHVKIPLGLSWFVLYCCCRSWCQLTAVVLLLRVFCCCTCTCGWYTKVPLVAALVKQCWYHQVEKRWILHVQLDRDQVRKNTREKQGMSVQVCLLWKFNNAQKCVYVHIILREDIHVCVCVCTYICIYIYKYICIHINRRIWANRSHNEDTRLIFEVIKAIIIIITYDMKTIGWSM